jgi:DNA-binding NtrC family response regulator
VERRSAERAATTDEDLDGRGQTVLVVDDEPAMMQTTARVLRRHGYRVLEAASFEAALEIAAGQHLDVLVTDSVMPQGSGGQLAEQVRLLRPGAAVVVMSGDNHGAGSHRLTVHGAAMIEKPFTVERLLRQVRAAMSDPGAGP